MPGIAEGELTSIALCWRLERLDGAGLAVTSHDEAVSHDGVAFVPTPGITPAAVSRSLGLEPDSGEIAGALSSDSLDAGDLALGRWDGARVRLIAVDWEAQDALPIDLLAGELGEMATRGDSFSAELRGAAWRLEQPICPATSPGCRAHFGDKKCRVDLAGRTSFATIVGGNGGELLLDRSIGSAYLLGRLRYLQGANCGLATRILAVDGNMIRVRDLAREPIAAGCRVEVREGCDKRFATCTSRFDNAVNFRGEPHLPGNDLLTRFPGG
ncbi:MAG: DUF2163 domain-containing protein [Sphingomonas sp.]|nr:DUF2163 domain-containing protein [Sphingomonas sp.]